VSLHELKASASRCHTPKQFRELVDQLQTWIPYRGLVCGWGYPANTTIGFIFHLGPNREFLRWYLSKGMLSKGPVFQEWLRTKKTHIWLDAARRLKDQFDPELLERIIKFNLQYSMGGGLVSQDLWIYFAVNMGSEESCRTHLKLFTLLVPILCRALQRACPRPLLTNRETVIMQRRAMGELIKQIAVAEGISARTVREHLQCIKKKLYTHDLVNAVVIACKSGMLDETWKEWRLRSEGASHR
jgi:DNA-binding CsgD family transcriptional regulator